MHGVILTFEMGEAFDAGRLSSLAEGALPKFRSLPGLRSKTFMLDPVARQAVNVYLWESEATARAFFSEEVLAGVTRVYGVRPRLQHLPVIAQVENTVRESTP
ncbi:MAG: hypothetical protein RL026_2141 [Pseudomonadota bacterium]